MMIESRIKRLGTVLKERAFVKSWLTNIKENKLLYALALATFVIHLATGWQYGYFRDELYYYSMSNHLDFGYVDISPIVPFLMRFSRLLFGESVFAFHIIPALCRAVIVLVAANITKKLGGGKFACLLTGIVIFAAPMFQAFGAMFTYDIFDQLTSAIFIYTIVLILNAKEESEYKRAWILFGIAAGIGLMVKISIMFLAFSFVMALLLTKNRAFFKTKHLWRGALIALLIFSPYIVWQIQHGGLILEYWVNYASYKVFRASPLEFILMETVVMNPLSLPLWIGGLCYLLFHKKGRKYAVLGHMFWIYLVLAIIMFFKFYILAGGFLALISAGAIWVENWLTSKKAMRWRNIYAASVLFAGLLLLPIAVPVLPPETYVSIDRQIFSPLTGTIKYENIETEELPQHFGDRFGWEEMTALVADVYHSLPAEEKNSYAIFAMNYGEAGAINFFGKKYGLPEAISGHLSHYVWGPGEYDLDTVLFLAWLGPEGGFDPEEGLGFINPEVWLREELYDHVELAAVTNAKYAMPYENNVGIFICKGLKIGKDELWEMFKGL